MHILGKQSPAGSKVANSRSQRPRRPRTLRRLAHSALFAAVRGLAHALGAAVGTTVVSVIVWWLTHR